MTIKGGTVRNALNQAAAEIGDGRWIYGEYNNADNKGTHGVVSFYLIKKPEKGTK